MKIESLFRPIGRFIFGRALPRAAYPVVSGRLRGARFILGSLSGAGGGASIYFNKIEPEQSDAMAGLLSEGKVFFDIGANVGYYSILASRLVGETGAVIACEPVIRNLSFLHRHVDLNNSNNVRILAFACSDEDATANFSLSASTAMGHLSDGNAFRYTADSVMVPTIKLDTLAQNMKVRPDVMKIDVEGAEMKVLAGAQEILAKDKPAIFLSTHSVELRTSCLDHLRARGYEVRSLLPDSDSHEFLATIKG